MKKYKELKESETAERELAISIMILGCVVVLTIAVIISLFIIKPV